MEPSIIHNSSADDIDDWIDGDLDFETAWERYMGDVQKEAQHSTSASPQNADPASSAAGDGQPFKPVSPNPAGTNEGVLNYEESNAFSQFLDSLIQKPSSPQQDSYGKIDQELQKLHELLGLSPPRHHSQQPRQLQSHAQGPNPQQAHDPSRPDLPRPQEPKLQSPGLFSQPQMDPLFREPYSRAYPDTRASHMLPTHAMQAVQASPQIYPYDYGNYASAPVAPQPESQRSVSPLVAPPMSARQQHPGQHLGQQNPGQLPLPRVAELQSSQPQHAPHNAHVPHHAQHAQHNPQHVPHHVQYAPQHATHHTQHVLAQHVPPPHAPPHAPQHVTHHTQHVLAQHAPPHAPQHAPQHAPPQDTHLQHALPLSRPFQALPTSRPFQPALQSIPSQPTPPQSTPPQHKPNPEDSVEIPWRARQPNKVNVRMKHVNSEKKRRALISELYNQMCELLPVEIRELLPKSVVLKNTYRHMKMLEADNASLREKLTQNGVNCDAITPVVLEKVPQSLLEHWELEDDRK